MACLAKNWKSDYRKKALANHKLLDLKVTNETKQIVGRLKRYNAPSRGFYERFSASKIPADLAC